jgi:glycerol-3-phosphate dehydrogenase (NAD(P)+)
MKIGYLGAGAWGYALTALLISKGYEVTSWTIFPDLAKKLNETGEHPMLPGTVVKGKLHVTTDLREVLHEKDVLVESVTSAGIRPVFEQIKTIGIPKCPIITTSKGIEQNTGYVLSDVICEVLGENVRKQIGGISGPSYATDVIKGLPTSVTGTAYDYDVMMQTCQLFTNDTFRVYPNPDVLGVSFGGALKNVIAIACGIAEGLDLGLSARAALMTRGLHEIAKISLAKGCKLETLYGLAGMGDLCVTCSSVTSRNFKFGLLLAQGKAPDVAQKEIGMAVEGAYTTISAMQLSKQLNIPMPITECVYAIITGTLKPQEAVKALMQREIKHEHL